MGSMLLWLEGDTDSVCVCVCGGGGGQCYRFEREAQTVREWELSYCGEMEAQRECEGVGAIVVRGRDRQTQCV